MPKQAFVWYNDHFDPICISPKKLDEYDSYEFIKIPQKEYENFVSAGKSLRKYTIAKAKKNLKFILKPRELRDPILYAFSKWIEKTKLDEKEYVVTEKDNPYFVIDVEPENINMEIHSVFGLR